MALVQAPLVSYILPASSLQTARGLTAQCGEGGLPWEQTLQSTLPAED